MSPRDVYKCPKCNKNATKSQKTVGCAICGEYYHLVCGNVSIEQYDFMKKNKILKFICNECPRLPISDNIQEEIRIGFAALTASLEKELEKKIEESKQLLNERLESGLKAIEDKFAEITSCQPVDLSDVQMMKSDLKHCFDVVKVLDDATNDKLEKLQVHNSILQRRLNRTNIVIWGLPRNIKDLRVPVLKIFSLCNVSVLNTDIQHCTYFARGKAVLVKLNSVQVRDAVMINFNNNRNLMLSEVISTPVQSKIILNDHLTDAARKLISVCRKLRKERKIVKYKFYNYDVPKAKVVMVDGSAKLLPYDECVKLFDGLGNCSLSPLSISSPNISFR